MVKRNEEGLPWRGISHEDLWRTARRCVPARFVEDAVQEFICRLLLEREARGGERRLVNAKYARTALIWIHRELLNAALRRKEIHGQLDGPEELREGVDAGVMARESTTRIRELLEALDVEGIAVASGAACHSGATEPSHVLLAMGVDPVMGAGSIRLSLGWDTTATQIERVLDVLPGIVERVRAAKAAESRAREAARR